MRGEKERGKAGGVKGDLGTVTAVDEPLNTSLRPQFLEGSSGSCLM